MILKLCREGHVDTFTLSLLGPSTEWQEMIKKNDNSQ